MNVSAKYPFRQEPVRRTLALLIAGALSSVAATADRACAWGCDGHYTVALVAAAQLNDAARRKADDLLRKNRIDPRLDRFCDAERLGRFADASTWADDVRNTVGFAHTAAWHYVNIPRRADRTRLARACSTQGCVTKAIVDQIAILKSDAKGRKKADALRFLIHFVADVHQPLHCATNSDRGGNCVPVAFFGRNPSVGSQGKATPNLHSVWDNGIIARHPSGRSPKRFADELAKKFRTRIPAWRAAGVHVDDWAWESHALAESVAYGKLPRSIPVEPERDVPACVVGRDDISRRMLAFDERLGRAYQDAAAPVVEEQLAKAGTRLAMILNDVWR